TTGTPPTKWVVTVTGTSGSLSHSVDVTFTVVSSTPVPDFTMTANPSSLNISAGTTGKSTITLTSLNGFSGTVNLYTSPSPLCPYHPSHVMVPQSLYPPRSAPIPLQPSLFQQHATRNQARTRSQ